MPRARTTARASRTASTASAIRSTLPRNSSTPPFLHCSLRLRDRGSNRVSDTDAFTSRPSRPAFVPRTTGRRQGTTGTAGASNPQVREPDSGIGAGSETGPENTLKVETRVRTPLGLSRSEHVSESRDCPWPRIGPAACTEPSAIRIRCRVASVLTVSAFKPFLARREGGAEGGPSRHLPCCTLGTTTCDDASPPCCQWVRSHGGLGQSCLQRLMWQNDWFRETRGARGTARRSERRSGSRLSTLLPDNRKRRSLIA